MNNRCTEHAYIRFGQKRALGAGNRKKNASYKYTETAQWSFPEWLRVTKHKQLKRYWQRSRYERYT